MKRVIAIFFLMTYLFGGTDASQVVKLPLLVSHYIKHKKENPSTTVASFLILHYVGPQPIDSDYQQDMQLPFKTCLDVSVVYSPTILPEVPQLAVNSQEVVRIKYSLLDDRAPLYSFPHSIFQPPKA